MPFRPALRVVAVLAALGLAACQKTTVEQSPAGTTVTTTTLGPTESASAALARAGGEAASAATSLGEGAARVAMKIGEAASQAATTVEEKAPDVLQSASAGLAKAGDAIGRAASSAATTIEAKTPGAVQSASAALSRAGDAIGDAAITAKVKTAYLADTDVKGLRIDVDTKDGVVTLTGMLDRRAQVEKAEAIARRIEGVKSVESRLTAKAG
jgi:hyperosmotically inducible protein